MEKRPSELPSVGALAFLGDAVHSLYIRRMLVGRGIPKSGALNEQALHYVTAEAQAAQAAALLPLFTEAEADIYRRAYNSSHLQRPRHARGADYRAATGLEAVLGLHGHLGNTARIEELMAAALAATEDAE